MSMQTNDPAVAQALAESVRKVGPDLGGQPRRVQAMLNDVLGSNARTHRTEIDALVLTAGEGIPGNLLNGQRDERVALERLRARGLDDELARFALDTWAYAFGVRGSDALPPTLPASHPTAAPGPAQREPMTAEPTVLPYWPAGTPGDPGPGRWPPNTAGYDPGGSYGSETTATPSRRKRLWTGLAAAAALIAVISLIAIIANQYLRSEPTSSSPAGGQGATITGGSATAPPSQPSPSTSQSSSQPPAQQPAQPPAQQPAQPPAQQPSQATQPSQGGSPSTQRAPSSRPSTATNPAPAPAVNKQPIKIDDSKLTANRNCSANLGDWYIYVLDQFYDPDGDALQITSATASAGTAQVAEYGGRPSIRWVEPYLGATGYTTVRFTVADGRGGTSSGILTITILNQCR